MTVVVLTSGTSFTIPGDWTPVNKIETWGGGGGGGGALTANAVASSGGGSGGYSASSNVTGLSGSVTISIGAQGTAGAATNTAGGNGGPTWFNGATQSVSTVSANGGGGGQPSIASGTVAGGLAATTTGATGSTQTTGSVGGTASTTNNGWAGAGAGAPGPDGLGAAGGNGGVADPHEPGIGGNGDNGLGGAGGLNGENPTQGAGQEAGFPGGSNVLGGGGGGGAADNAGTGGGPGGAGGLPGGGGGGQSAFTTNGAGGAGGGGQIRITYTPNVLSYNNLISTSLPPGGLNQRQKGDASPIGYDYGGWKSSPLSANTVMGYQWTPVPAGRFNGSSYQDWSKAPQGAPTNRPSLVYDIPQAAWGSRKAEVDYKGWQIVPRPAEFRVPLASTEVPKGRYNWSAYQDQQAQPQPLGIQPSHSGLWTDLPLTRNPLFSYQGSQSGPLPPNTQPTPVSVATDVPKGTWSVSAYQFHTAGYQRAEFQAPLPVVDVPRGKVLFDYSGWSSFQPPLLNPVQIQGSRSTDLPPSGLLSLRGAKDLYAPVYFQGSQGSPPPANNIGAGTACWLPLVYVGNGFIGGGGTVDVRQGTSAHAVPPLGLNLFTPVYSGIQASPLAHDNAGSFTSISTDVPRSTQSDKRWDYSGIQHAPQIADNSGTVSSRSTDTPLGLRSNPRWDYAGVQHEPVSAVTYPAGNVSWDVPRGITSDRRWDYSGFTIAPLIGNQIMMGLLVVAP
jgi:hypothetical protein